MGNRLKPRLGGPNWFATLDEARAPNVKQYLRGLRNYFVLSKHVKVSSWLSLFT